MNEKFMQLKKMVIPTITVLVITSQLCGCATVNSDEAAKMIKNNEAIEITIAEPVSVEQGSEIPYEWVQLAQLTTYEDFRTTFDSLMNVTKQGVDGKNGPVYINLSGDQTDNSTLYYAFMNKTFVNQYWNNAEKMEELIKAINEVYGDIESDAEAQTAILNAYFNIFPDAEPNYFNGSSTLTRGEFLAGFYRATTPVQELEENQSFTELVGKSDSTIYAQQIADKSYLDTTSKSLNKDTFTGTITRAEALYTIVKTYYPDEYAKVSGEETAYVDVKNGGNIAEKQKYIKYDKKSSAWSKPDYWKSYELYYAVNNPDKGLPTDLYKALVVAYNHNLISTTDDSNWELGLTKSDAIQLLINTYEDLVNSGNYLTDLELGKAFNIATDQTSSSGGTGSSSTENNAEATNGGEGSSALDADEHMKLEKIKNPETGIEEMKVVQDLYIEEDGVYKFSEDFYTMTLNHPFFQDASVSDISNYFNNENPNMLLWLEIGDIDEFNKQLDWLYQQKGQPFVKKQQSSTTSNSSSTASQNQSQQSTTSNQQSTSNTPSTTPPQTTEQPSTTPDSQQQQANQQTDPFENMPGTFSLGHDTDAGDGGELVGNTVLNP